MNTKTMENVPDQPISTVISEALLKLKKEPEKEGVDLLEIAKKLSTKKFGKK